MRIFFNYDGSSTKDIDGPLIMRNFYFFNSVIKCVDFSFF